MGRARTLAQVYRRFGEVDAAGTSPLYERVAVALSESDEALRAIEAAPARKRHPTLILAALHDLALAGRAPALASAYAAGDGDAAVGAAIDTLLAMTDSVVAIAARRRARIDEAGRCTVLYPAIAEAAHRVGADAIGLIDVGCSAGLNLGVDRVGITYSDGQIAGRPVLARPAVVVDRGRPARPDAGDARGRRPDRHRPRPGRRHRRGRRPMAARLPAAGPAGADRAARRGAGAGGDGPSAAAARRRRRAAARRRRPGARRRAAGRHHDVGAVARPARRAAGASCSASRRRRPAGRWRGCRRRGSASRRRSRRSATAPPPATASSGWRCSTGRAGAPRPSAAAGRRAACWRGWRTSPEPPPSPASARGCSGRRPARRACPVGFGGRGGWPRSSQRWRSSRVNRGIGRGSAGIAPHSWHSATWS